jgi:hypothetical protein
MSRLFYCRNNKVQKTDLEIVFLWYKSWKNASKSPNLETKRGLKMDIEPYINLIIGFVLTWL